MGPAHAPSHGADAFQTAAASAFTLISGLSASMLRRGPMRRPHQGLGVSRFRYWLFGSPQGALVYFGVGSALIALGVWWLRWS